MGNKRENAFHIIAQVVLIILLMATGLFERIEFELDQGNSIENHKKLLAEETNRIENKFELIEKTLISENQEIKKYEDFGGALDVKLQELLDLNIGNDIKIEVTKVSKYLPLSSVAYIELNTGNKIVKSLENSNIDIELAINEYNKVSLNSSKEITRSNILSDNEKQYFFYYIENPNSKLLIVKIDLESISSSDNTFNYKYVKPFFVSLGKEVPPGEIFTNKDDLDNTLLAKNRLLIATSAKYNLNYYTSNLEMDSSNIVIFKKIPYIISTILGFLAIFTFIGSAGIIARDSENESRAFILCMLSLMGYVLLIMCI